MQQRITLLEKELIDSEHTHKLRCAFLHCALGEFGNESMDGCQEGLLLWDAGGGEGSTFLAICAKQVQRRSI